MPAEIDPGAVAARLADLRARYQPESLDDARGRLARERPRHAESFELIATRSLAELRALCDLARYLHQMKPVR